jgi:hypothetical protein
MFALNIALLRSFVLIGVVCYIDISCLTARLPAEMTDPQTTSS